MANISDYSRVCIFCVLIRVTHDTMCPISYSHVIRPLECHSKENCSSFGRSSWVWAKWAYRLCLPQTVAACVCVSSLVQCDWTLFNLCKAWMHVTRKRKSTYLASVILRSVFNFSWGENETRRKSESSQTATAAAAAVSVEAWKW